MATDSVGVAAIGAGMAGRAHAATTDREDHQ